MQSIFIHHYLFFLDWGAGPSKTDMISPTFIDDEACNPVQTFLNGTSFNFPSSKNIYNIHTYDSI